MERAVESTLQRVALLDLFLTLPFALPVVAPAVVGAIIWLDRTLGLATPMDPLGNLGTFFLNLMGVLAVCWNGARAVSGSTELGRIDVPARGVVAALIVGYVILGGVTPLLLVFVVTELGGAPVQGRALFR
jgi:hypothetical protein